MDLQKETKQEYMFTTQKHCNSVEKIYDSEFCYIQNDIIGKDPWNVNIKNLFVFGSSSSGCKSEKYMLFLSICEFF